MPIADHMRSSASPSAALMRLAILIAVMAIPAMARAESAVPSDVYVERQEHRADGSRQIRLEPAAQVRSGDTLVFRLRYQPGNQGSNSRKLLTSAVPEGVRFTGGGDIVSVDGGASWGRLDDLVLRGRDGRTRRATPEDVTHVRWTVDGTATRRAGLLFRGQAR